MSDPDSARVAVVAENLRRSELRIAQACRTFGRENDDNGNPVTLIVVTKTYPESDVKILRDLGVRNVGENRDQEARAKASLSPLDMVWHMIGQIQRNKVNSIVAWADLVHTCDRLELVPPLSRAAINHSKEVGVFVQVNLDPSAPANRGGVQPMDMLPLAAEITEAPGLTLMGLMAVAPHPSTGIAAGGAFERLSELSLVLRAEYPHASFISAGMSNDLEEAIAHGATHVRLGSAILGERPMVQ